MRSSRLIDKYNSGLSIGLSNMRSGVTKKQKVFFHLQLSLLYRLSIQIRFIDTQFAFESKNPFNNA